MSSFGLEHQRDSLAGAPLNDSPPSLPARTVHEKDVPNHYLLFGSERYALAILRPLQAAIRARGDKVAWFFERPSVGANELSTDETLLRSVSEVRAWNPRATFTSSNTLPPFFPGLKVQVFHGFDAGKPRHVYVRPFFDLYCTTGPEDTQAFTRMAQRLGYFAVRETGWPKMDHLFRTLPASPPPVRRRPVILYHSTFSPSWSAAEVLHAEVARLSRKGNWKWIVALHPKMRVEVVDLYRALEGPNLRFATEDNIVDLFPCVDLMCSDTSSALNEFLLTRKPVVTFRNRRPGPHLIDIDSSADFEPAITTALTRPGALMAAIDQRARTLHPSDDARASERVLEAADQFIESGGIEQLASKPFDFWRRFKIRYRLRYWAP